MFSREHPAATEVVLLILPATANREQAQHQAITGAPHRAGATHSRGTLKAAAVLTTVRAVLQAVATAHIVVPAAPAAAVVLIAARAAHQAAAALTAVRAVHQAAAAVPTAVRAVHQVAAAAPTAVRAAHQVAPAVLQAAVQAAHPDPVQGVNCQSLSGFLLGTLTFFNDSKQIQL